MDRLRRLARSDGLGGRFSRYVVVGGSAAVVDLGGFVLLSAAGAGVLPAAAGSFGLAAAYNFVLQALVVFRAAPTPRRLALFAAFSLVGLAVNTGATTLAALWLAPVLAKVAGIGVAFAANFAMNNAVVFARGRVPAEAAGPGG